MNKNEFLAQLRTVLSDLPKSDAEEQLSFYSEMIDDRMEEGLSEEEALSAIGSMEEIRAQIQAEISALPQKTEKDVPKARNKALEIILLVLGSPIWLSVLLAVAAIILAAYICLLSLIVVLWSVFAAVASASAVCIPAGFVLAFTGNVPGGLAFIAAGLAGAGLSVFLFYGSRAGTKGIWALIRKSFHLYKFDPVWKEKKVKCAEE